MHTAKFPTPDDAMLAPLSESHAADRGAIAREHAALFPTRLAIARWTGGDSPRPHGAEGAHAPLRAAWLAQAQRNFQAWLEAGGFGQHGDAAPATQAEETALPAEDKPAPDDGAHHAGACI